MVKASVARHTARATLQKGFLGLRVGSTLLLAADHTLIK